MPTGRRDTNSELTWLHRAGPDLGRGRADLSGWGLLTWHYAALPWWLVLPLGGYLLAWHGSLQHEAVHGQLAPWRWLNDAIALPPLGLWLPFPIYRATHRAHHDFAILTEPWRDPEVVLRRPGDVAAAAPTGAHRAVGPQHHARPAAARTGPGDRPVLLGRAQGPAAGRSAQSRTSGPGTCRSPRWCCSGSAACAPYL